MISHKGKFIFIPVRRAAGTSINTALRAYCNEALDEDLESAGQMHLFNRGVLSTRADGEDTFGDWYEDIEKYKDYFVFSIIRNPWERLVSGYFYSDKGNKYLGRKCSSLKEFIENLPTKEMSYRWWFHVTRTLTEMLIDKDGKYIADFTIRFENLQSDFTKVCEKLNFQNIELPQKSKTKHTHYSSYYNEETMQMVAEKFAADIEYFNYQFDDQSSKGLKGIVNKIFK